MTVHFQSGVQALLLIIVHLSSKDSLLPSTLAQTRLLWTGLKSFALKSFGPKASKTTNLLK